MDERDVREAEGLGNDYPVHAGAEGERIDGQFWGGIHLREGRERGIPEGGGELANMNHDTKRIYDTG